MALYHYVLKSAAEFAEKMTRGSGAGNRKDWDFFLDVEAAATDNCTYGQEVAREFLASKPRLYLHSRRREAEQRAEDAAVAVALQQRQLVLQRRQEEQQQEQQRMEQERLGQEGSQQGQQGVQGLQVSDQLRGNLADA